MANQPGFNSDLDYLSANDYAIRPSDYIKDTTVSRIICDPGGAGTYSHSFHGPSLSDDLTKALHAVEMDAYWYVTVAP